MPYKDGFYEEDDRGIVRFGDCFKINVSYDASGFDVFMLCREEGHVSLQSLKNGNSWNGIHEAEIRETSDKRNGISWNEFNRFFGGDRFVQVSRPYELRKYNNSEVE